MSIIDDRRDAEATLPGANQFGANQFGTSAFGQTDIGSAPFAPEPATARQAAATPGWFDDPAAQHRLRYHDGQHWTPHVTHFGPTPCSGCG